MELFSFYNYSKQRGDSDKNEQTEIVSNVMFQKKKEKKNVQSELINAAAQTTLIQNH